VLTRDVPTMHTLGFVREHTQPCRLLEVGCGDGALAARLMTLGYRVVAIDASAEAIAKAKARGVDARVARWPEFDDAPFDVVVFTRSLHHIEPLDRSVVRAKELLQAGGRLLVEDFSYREIDPLSAEWLYQMTSLLDAGGFAQRDEEDFARRVAQGEELLAAWQGAHHHDLHTADAMAASIREVFGSVETTNAPYLYRYICALLGESERGHRIASRLLELEHRFAETAGLPLIGRRFVATRAAGAGG
jgi:2-polyprenyl-3-methyl-5-hydroxy-6-metoxy-1,4-benzoquinol methylase